MKKFLIFIFLLLLTSCITFKTFYSSSITSLSVPKKVYRLNLSYSTKAPNLSDYKELKMLNLSHVKDINIIDKVINNVVHPNKIKILLLDNCNLKQLPNSVLKFTQLEQLSLSGNTGLNFNLAFKELSKLNKIEFLNCQFNKLESIPKSISELKSLEELNLSNNNLRNLTNYKDLSGLPNLKSLWLRNNKIELLSENVNKLSQLVNFYLENNLLTQLPSQLSGLKSLRVLHLSFNKFKELPIEVQSIPKLLLLHIDHCKITDISNVFTTKSTSIRGLVINNNLLTQEKITICKAKFKSFFLLIF